MSFFQRLSNFLTVETTQNKVLEVKSDKYIDWVPAERGQKGMMLYSKDGTFDIVLHLPSAQHSYSIFRSKNREEAEQKFWTVYETVPTLVGIASEVNNLNGVQKICDTLTENPYWNLAHLSVLLDLGDSLSISPVSDCINGEDPLSGLTPLLLAVKSTKGNDKLNIIKKLLQLGASPTHVDFSGNSVLHFAAETTKEIIKVLAESSTALLDLKNKKGFTPLHISCQCGKPECVKALCAAGANVNIEASAIDSGSSSSPPASSIGSFLDQPANKLTKEDVKMGGTPLHWCSSKEVIEVLVNMNCDINARNFNGAPPLHVMIFRNRFECALALLTLNADLDMEDNTGQTALQLAVQQKSIPIVQALVAFYVNINFINNDGYTARHLIAAECEKTSNGDPTPGRILYILDAVGAKRCSDNVRDCSPGCKSNTDFSGIPPSPPRTLPIRSVMHLLDGMCEQMDEHINSKGYRVLCLDGGGIRGLILIAVLLHLEIELHATSLINYFDWIAGTSTGGMLALALVAGKSLKECLCLYLRMRDIAFCGSRPYDCAPLESLLKSTFGEQSVMADLGPAKVMITGVIASEKPLDLHLFRNYVSPSEIMDPSCPSSSRSDLKPPHEQLIWEAARSSGAAPTYYKQHSCFIDGGLISNNPTLDTLCEINEYNTALEFIGRGRETVKPKVVLSVGTGLPPVTDLQLSDLKASGILSAVKMVTSVNSLVDILTDQATQANGRIVDRAKNWCSMLGIKYFRFNPQLTEDIVLNETKGEKLINMLWETRAYMAQNKDKVMKLWNFLQPVDNQLKR